LLPFVFRNGGQNVEPFVLLLRWRRRHQFLVQFFHYREEEAYALRNLITAVVLIRLPGCGDGVLAPSLCDQRKSSLSHRIFRLERLRSQ
jgi:hypothetical protein